MRLAPKEGWGKFARGDEVIELIADHLKLEENQGIWQFYSFADNSSVWCSDETEATNQLQVTFNSNTNEAHIRSLGVELTNNSSEYFKQLYRLKRQLKSRFNVQEE